MKQFEYKNEKYYYHLDLKKLNELGRKGWEVVNIMADSNKYCIEVFMKREIPEETNKNVL